MFSKIFPDICALTILTLCLEVCFGIDMSSNSGESQYHFPKVGDYKFLVSVSSKAGICTGSIINENWILTAAHCLYFREKVIGGNAVTIKAGITNYDYSNANSRQETMSLEIHVHPRFWYNKPSKFDVALVKLRDSLVFDAYVDKITVAGEQWPDAYHDGQDFCMAFGYGGYQSTAPPTTDLKAWNVTARHGEDACPCAKRFQWKRLVCVRELSASRMCQADDGGPLVCGDKVWAIGHMAWNRATCDNAVYPVVKCVGGPDKALTLYMFLCPMNDWMHSIVPDIPSRPPSCDASVLIRNWILLFINFVLQLYVI